MAADPRPPGQVLAYVGLGSNLGDRADHISRALELLDGGPDVRVSAVSELYETPPWGYVAQPPFLNAAARLTATLGPRQLLLALKSVESRFGRQTTVRWGPRVIDLDLLIYGNLRLSRRGLEVPHPGMLSRAFVLVPLRDVFPSFRGPDGAPIHRLIERAGTDGISRRGAVDWRRGMPR